MPIKVPKQTNLGYIHDEHQRPACVHWDTNSNKKKVHQENSSSIVTLPFTWLSLWWMPEKVSRCRKTHVWPFQVFSAKQGTFSLSKSGLHQTPEVKWGTSFALLIFLCALHPPHFMSSGLLPPVGSGRGRRHEDVWFHTFSDSLRWLLWATCPLPNLDLGSQDIFICPLKLWLSR